MISDNTRPSLLSRVRNPDDHEAWREFESRYGALITRYCRSVRLQHSDAEDVRQILMLNLSSALRSFKYDPAKGRFRTYLGRAVRNAVFQVQKCPAGRGIPLPLNDGGVSDVDTSDAQGLDDELWDRHWREHHLRRAFETLRKSHNPRSIDAFDCLLAGRSVVDVAGKFDLSVAAVKKIKQRIRARLRGIVAEQIAEEADYGSGAAPEDK